MDQEVAKTLGELELKLQELERELTSIGRRDAQPKPGQAPGKLIDEAVEGDGHGRTDDGGESAGWTNADTGTDAGMSTGAGTDTGMSNGIDTDTGMSTGADTGIGMSTGAGIGTSTDTVTDRWVDAEGDEDERAVDNAFGGPAVFGGEEVPAQGNTIERGSAFPVSETAYGEIATGSASSPSSFPSGVFSPTATGGSQPGPPLPPPMTPQQPQHPQAPQYQQHQQYTQHPQQGQPPASASWPPPGPAPQPPSPAPPGPPPSTTPPGPPSAPPSPTPQPPPPPQPIDRAELVRFKEKMQRTMEDLIDEYGRLLLPKPPA